MSFVTKFFRRSKRAKGEDLNAAVKADFYVRAGDNDGNLLAQGKAAASTKDNQNCCASTFRSMCVKSPFGVFCTAAICWNIPAIILALTDLTVLSEGCHASIWLLLNAVFACVHIAAAVYIALSSSSDSSRLQQKKLKLPPGSVFAKAKSLFCFNSKVVCYLWFVVLYAAFTFVPLLVQFHDQAQDFVNKYSNNDNSNNNNGANGGGNYNNGNYNQGGYNSNNNNSDYASLQAAKCHHFSHEKVLIAMGFAWAFLLVGGGALAVSFCVAYNAESLLRDDGDDKATHGGESNSSVAAATGNTTGEYHPPSTSIAHQQPQPQPHGTFDDADEENPAPLNHYQQQQRHQDDAVLANRAVTPPPRSFTKEIATQTTTVKDNTTQTEQQEQEDAKTHTDATANSNVTSNDASHTNNHNKKEDMGTSTSTTWPNWSQNFTRTLSNAITTAQGNKEQSSSVNKDDPKNDVVADGVDEATFEPVEGPITG